MCKKTRDDELSMAAVEKSGVVYGLSCATADIA